MLEAQFAKLDCPLIDGFIIDGLNVISEGRVFGGGIKTQYTKGSFGIVTEEAFFHHLVNMYVC